MQGLTQRSAPWQRVAVLLVLRAMMGDPALVYR
jgi:hypothetical protein